MTHTKHKFKYTYIDDNKFLRPYILITLKNNEKTLPVLALVDSGADFSMFDGELANILDIDLTKLQKIDLSGINGTAQGHVAHIEIGVENSFIHVPAVFSFDFSPNGFGGVIGQMGFFDNYVVVFDRANKRLLLK